MRKILFLSVLFLIQTAHAQKPQLSFFNEQEGKLVKQLFQDTTLIPILKELNAEIRMGILDTTSDRVEVVKKLNDAGIPVVAWLLLPKEKGYWFHSGNSKDAFDRYREIKNWAEQEGIKFSGIGIDLELDYNDVELFKTSKLKFFGDLIRRLYAKDEFMESKKQYENLIDSVRKDGFPIESYYIPVIRYETEKGHTALQQVSKFLDIRTDKDIPMLYTSLMGDPYGLLKVLAIDENVEAVGLGITGGGVDPTMNSMTWEDLAYDLRLASQTAKELHIFCLEASAEKGFLPKLINFDYNVPVKEYPEQVKDVQSKIKGIMLLSDMLSHPTLLIIGILILTGVLIWIIYLLIKFGVNLFRKRNLSK